MPVFVIVGRPNVGKSTLFNRLIRKREAIVRPEPGVTRDRHYGKGEWNGAPFLSIDTGGIAPAEEDPFHPMIAEQTRAAIGEADVVLFLVDGLEGILPGDHQIAEMLRASGKPVILLNNKSDAKRSQETALDAFRLGLGEPCPISAEHGLGVDAMMEEAFRLAPDAGPEEEEADEREIRVAVVGRPNVGKSSFVNRLLGKERSLVSATPGTTRDPIDSLCERGGVRYRFVDTAGIRRRGRIGDHKVEALSMILAYRSIERAEVSLLIIDAVEGPGSMDAHIARHIIDSGRACAILLNKWDLVSKDTRTFDEAVRTLRDKLVHVDFAPIVSVSALTGQRCEQAFHLIDKVATNHRRRVPTAQLNEAMGRWTHAHPFPATRAGKRPKLFYVTQPSVAPPHFVLFTSLTRRIPFEQYGRFLEKRLREEFDFEGTPLRVSFRSRREPRPSTRGGHTRKR